MDNVPYGSDNSDAPWNEKFDQIGHCEICDIDIYEDQNYTSLDWGVYYCEDCIKNKEHETDY
jgi:hypothetical protein